MGLLDDLLGGTPSQEPGHGRRPGQQGAAGGGMSSVMMALLPVVLSMLASRGGARGQTGGGLGDILGQVLGGGAGQGGLGGLLEQMQRAGLEQQARSWVSTGPNLPLPTDQVGQIFGHEGVDAIARHAGLTPEETSDGLAELLPEVVDHLTPEGRVPDLDQLRRSVEDLGQRLG